ncbi:MAG: ArnT family glycosyltransferase, partial [Roseiflexaceae bacterium]
MSFSERTGLLLLLGATLALAWIGQGLLLAEPPRLLGGAVILILAAVAFTGLTASPREDTAAQATSGWMARLQALAAHAPRNFALMAAGVVCGTLAYWFDADPAMQPWPVLLAWAAGIGLFLAGTWRLDEPAHSAAPPIVASHQAAPAEGEPLAAATGAQHAPQPDAVAIETRVEARTEYLLADQPETAAFTQPYARWEIAALIGLTLLALLARAVMIDGIPQNFGGDEGEMGMMARDVLRGQLISPFSTGWLSHPTLWFFMQALALRVFGNNIFGLRMLSVLIGTATIPALYLFARPLYGRSIALVAAALLAFYHFHIHFSRLALNNIVDPLLALLAFAAFFHGQRTRSLFSFTLAGVLLGLAQHFYMGGRLTPLV